MTSLAPTREEWSAALRDCEVVNLLQTWEYGEAKQSEGWRVERFILQHGGPVAAVQMLSRRVPALGTIARINRAPLIMSKDLPLGDAATHAIQWVRDELVKRGFTALSFAPELPANEATAAKLARAGFERAQAPAWASGLIDLTQDEVVRRRSIDRKWRNLLGKAERGGIAIETDATPEGVSRFMSHQHRFQSRKGFDGIASGLVLALSRGDGDVRLSALTAVVEDESVGGVLIAGHVNTATYLLSWNTPEGRRRSVNYLLLWRAVEQCRSEGYRWFDLGGIDHHRTPGIAHFKAGLRPTPYTLVGEHWAFPKGLRSRILRCGLVLRGQLPGREALRR